MTTGILIRFDDICPTMDHEQWARAVELLDRYEVHPLIAVIPECRDPELQIDPPDENFWKEVRAMQARGYTVAMHGCYHVYDTDSQGLVGTGHRSEFAGHPYEEQERRIRTGKQILEEHGVWTDIFCAPSHTYDENTLRALKAHGFRYVSDGGTKKPVEREGLLCLPCRFNGAPVRRTRGYYTAIFHAQEWARPEKAFAYGQLKALCEQERGNILDFEEYARQPMGNLIVQNVLERGFVIWRRRIKPAGRALKKCLKGEGGG